jgi:ANTAR domain
MAHSSTLLPYPAAFPRCGGGQQGGVEMQERLRTVVVVGEIVAEDGEVVATRGFYVDVTKGVQLHAIVTDRAVIEQAKGMLMVTYRLDADAAFEILRWRSQEQNIKLHNVARHIVDPFPTLAKVDTSRTDLDRFLISLDID